MTPELEALLAEARALPPMTTEQRRLQTLDFAYGNLAATTNHKPTREAFRVLCMSPPYSWSRARFDEWADTREWWTR